MIMTDEEICRDYRLAKNKANQVTVLADQNQCNRKEIIAVLLENGEKVDKHLIGHPNPRKSEQAAPVKRPKAKKISLTADEADALGRFLEDALPERLPKMELQDIHELTGIYKKLL